MAYTLENDHTTRFCTIRDTALKTIDREVVGYALVAVDAAGDVYYGADYSHDPQAQAAIEKWLKVMTKNCGELIKKGKGGP